MHCNCGCSISNRRADLGSIPIGNCDRSHALTGDSLDRESSHNSLMQQEKKPIRPLTPWITDTLLAASLGIKSDYFRWCSGVMGKYAAGELKPPTIVLHCPPHHAATTTPRRTAQLSLCLGFFAQQDTLLKSRFFSIGVLRLESRFFAMVSLFSIVALSPFGFFNSFSSSSLCSPLGTNTTVAFLSPLVVASVYQNHLKEPQPTRIILPTKGDRHLKLATLVTHWLVVGSRSGGQWTKYKFYEGVVESYDPVTRKHKTVERNRKEKRESIKDKAIHLLD
ncbi:hypothetical protein RIF29_14467 [Crotalaria pallida]|uniref:Uncharacterized protein n=1 Tax=Crotalaria pallida TaxID=3830 RepID=A0AAN9FHN9_CROPI